MTDRLLADGNRALRLRLAATRVATRAAMVIERGWPLLLPLVIVLSLFLTIAWFGLFGRLPDAGRLPMLGVFGVAALAALYPLRYFRAPSASEVDRRIETANNLAHAPVLAQTDRQSGQTSSFSDALWREHQRRMAASLGHLGADLPRTRVPERDRWGLRAAVALTLVTAFAFSFGPGGGSIADAFSQRPAAAPVAPRVDAWVTPPAYTGRAPIFLTAETNEGVKTFTVPTGSEVTLRVAGGAGDETLAYTEVGGNVRAVEPAAARTGTTDPSAGPDGSTSLSQVRRFAMKLTREGELNLTSAGQILGRWGFAITPDKPPRIAFAGDPKQAVNGALELRYSIADDYGAASAKADFALADPQPPNARPLYGPPDMPLSLPRRGAKDNGARTVKDLTEHVWAGTRTNVTLEATDGAGQTATSETRLAIMPERPFANPLARALVEQRRLLGLDANAKPRVLELMDAITLRPEDTFDNMSSYLAIMSARSRLKLASTDDQLRDVVSYLWDIALGIEDGNLSDAERRLRQAQQNLENLLKNNASDAEIDKAMKDLRQAMTDFLREFAQKHQNDQTAARDQNGQELRQSDLDKLMDQIQNLAKSGNKDQAQQLLSQLENMMNNLQAGRQQQNGERNSAMRKQMDKLGEIMRRQQEMMNETFRMDQSQRNQDQMGQNRDQQLGENGDQSQQQPFPRDGKGEQPGGKPMTPQEFADALKQLQEGQGKLQGDLEQLKKNLEGMGMQPNPGFGEAGRSMGNAEQSLGQGDPNQATGQQGKALEALRRGAQDMMKQMQAMQGDQGGSQEGGRQQDADRDPLGRPRASSGPDFGDSVKVPDEIDVQRARRILEAIRKRLGDALSPDIERSYLERLLDLK